MTRGNMYAELEFVGQIGSDAYPGGELWNALKKKKYLTHNEYMEIVKEFKNEDEFPVGNYSYEFNWHPCVAPEYPWKYSDWGLWKGIVLVRRFSVKLTSKWGQSYVQLPTQWVRIQDYRKPKGGAK